MGTWYCDNEECGEPFFAHTRYLCNNPNCEECHKHVFDARVFCSKKCHDKVMNI
jgi:hypothetical protein